jgi:hypothetical protein
MMNNKLWSSINMGDIYSIPNAEMNPIFKLVLADNGTNYYNYIPSGWKDFSLVLSYPGQDS